MAGGMRAFLLFIISALHCARAIAEERTEVYEFDIPRSPIGSAITEIAQQTTGFSIGFLPRPDEKNILVGPLQGRFTIADALTELFSGTDFEWEVLSPGNIHVFNKAQERRSVRKAERAMSPMGSHTRQTRPQSGTIVVLASRVDVDAGLLPSTTLHSETIESYGVSTLGELFRYLPQIPFMRSAESRVAGEQYADLRGLGAGTTLVLINGRRVGPMATSFDTGAFDINTIPLTAVKRVEISFDSHSVATGADAIGGTINIVLQDDIPFPVLQLKYGAAEGGAEEGRVSGGLGISRERFRATATVDVFHREYLFGSERDLTADQDFRRFGRSDMRSTASSPANISSLTGQNLPGLSSPFAAVPAGSDSLSIEDFVATAGQRNLVSFNRYRSFEPKTTRGSGVANAELRVTDAVDVFAELLAVDRKNYLQVGPPTVYGVISPTNPFNPFGEPVVVASMIEDLDAVTWVAKTSLLRGVVGAAASFDTWSAQISVTAHDEDARLSRENDLDPVKVAQALNASEADRALNFFHDGSPGTPELLQSLRAGRSNDRFDSQYANAHFSLRGPVMKLAGGDVQLLLGGEWRREGLSTPALGSRQRIATASFGEINLPLVAPSMEVPSTRSIDLTLGVRSDRDDFGTHMTGQYTLTWSPVSQIAVDVSYRDFFRSPNLYDLHLSRFSIGPTVLPDPGRGYELGTFMITIGGNTSLAPNSGRAWTARLNYAPTDNVSFSAGYWNTAIHDRITYLTIPFTLANEAHFPSRVVRADPTPQDRELGLPGKLIGLDVSPGNYGELTADGMDLAIKGSWTTRLGRLSPAVTGTWNHKFSTVTADLAPQQRVGVGSDEGTIPRWRALASVNFERGAWSLFSALRFTSHYEDVLFGARNGRSIGASIQVDAQASIQLDRFAPKALDGFTLTGGATNLLDEDPSYSEVLGSDGFDGSQVDLRQRFWYIGLRKTF